MKNVKNANVDESVAPAGTNIFLKIAGAETQNIHLFGNDFHAAKTPYVLDSDVKPASVTALDNFIPAK